MYAYKTLLYPRENGCGVEQHAWMRVLQRFTTTKYYMALNTQAWHPPYEKRPISSQSSSSSTDM